MINTRLALTLGTVLTALALVPASAQSPTSAVTGTVRDSVAAQPLDDVTVVARNTATGYEYPASTSATGRYWLRGLSPGTYDVTVRRIGLRPAVRRGVVLAIGRTVTLDFTLTSAAVELAAVEIVATRPLVETTESEISYVLSRAEIERLPEESRQFIDLARLVPGTTGGTSGSSIPPLGSAGSSIGALNSRSAGVLVDGADFTEPAFGELSGSVPLLAIQEFEVILTQFSAELGRAASGVVNAVTRRGGNEFSLEGFGLYRHKSLNALGEFETAKPDFNRSHWGVAVGGPIVRDRTHFFGVFERRVQNDFATVNTGGVFPTFEGTFKTPLTDNLLFARLDHRFNASHDLSVRYSGEIGKQLLAIGGTSSAEQGVSNQLNVHSVLATHRWSVSASAINEARFHVLRRQSKLVKSTSGPAFVYPSLIRGGFFFDAGFDATRLEFKDDLSLALTGSSGTHRLKFGTHLSWHQNDILLGVVTNGVFVYADDLAPDPLLATLTLNQGSVTSDAANFQLALYVQDDWNPIPDLTLSLGVRYDIETNGTNQGFVSPFAGQLPFIRTEPRGIDKNNIAPRIGFAWDPTGNGETVIRGGFGIFYDASVMYPLGALERSSGIRRATVFFPGTTDIDAIFSGIDPATVPVSIWPTGDIQTPMTRQFSLGVQHALPSDIVVRVDGIYTEGRNLLIERNLATIDPATMVPAFPGFGFIGQILTEGEAEAKMLLVEIRKAFSRGWVNLSYTLADRKNTTDGWNDFSTQVDPNSIDFSSEWGPAAWDERHRLIATGGVDLPYGLNITAKTVYSSARPYSAFTGTDDNGDGNPDSQLNDRPAGERRNTRRGPDFFRTDLGFRWSPTLRGGTQIGIIANVYNLFNTTNLDPTSVNVNMLAPTFGQALAALAKRQLEVGVQIRY
ncbi:MAG: TonB-dependent receptor [Gemmatimonadetes bacterium]|nr:TonB-dependent receptor [Gemmatimonadota bacterium]